MQTNQTSVINNEWTEVITPQASLFDLKIKDVWRYRDLLMLLVRRDFVSAYKQTILGPIWFFLQPLFITITFTFTFGGMDQPSIADIPKPLFFMTGITLWNYFADCLTKTATVFKDNASIFGKVYFPRLVMPLSIIISSLVKFGIQFLLLIGFWVYYLITTNQIHPNIYMLLLPVLIVLMAAQGLGWGMIISSLTTKYRDLIFLLTFGVQLLMFISSVIIPFSDAKGKLHTLMLINPLTPIIEIFKYSLIGNGVFTWPLFIYSILSSVVVVVVGAVIFTKVEKSFMDTV